MPVPPSQPCGRSVHDENMSRTATFCPIWEENERKSQNREWHILELMASYEMHRISFPASPRAQFSLQKNQHREKILNADGQRANVQRVGKSGLIVQRLGIVLLVLRANAGSAASRRRVQNYRQLKNAIFRNHCRYAVILFSNCLN
jgi:tRNA nucleotidyltransferase/poly(A) polymerase